MCMYIDCLITVSFTSFCSECKELLLQLRKQMEEVRAKEEESVLVEQEQALLMEEQDQLYQAVSGGREDRASLEGGEEGCLCSYTSN